MRNTVNEDQLSHVLPGTCGTPSFWAEETQSTSGEASGLRGVGEPTGSPYLGWWAGVNDGTLLGHQDSPERPLDGPLTGPAVKPSSQGARF